MADFDDLYPQVKPEVPGCPDLVVENAVRNALREFCEESTFWRVEHNPITTVTDESATGEYTLTPPAGSKIVTVLEPIIHRNELVWLKSRTWLDKHVVKWREKTDKQIDYALMKSPSVIRVVPYPETADENNDLLVSIAVKPDNTTTSIDDGVFDDWYEAIAAGAKARLMAMPEKQWSNAKLSDYYRSYFNNRIEEAFSKITSGHQKQKTDRHNKVRPHYF